jgi:hypothetical protein
MKHSAITLLKFKCLAARLSLPLWQTVGLLESLWLFAMHHARDGNLSRFSPTDIAAWLETRWLERGGDGELLIHDWDDHKPTWLKGVQSRQLSQQPSGEVSSQLSTTTKLSTKSATKQVGLGWVNNRRDTNGARAKRFTKPTVDEVRAYCEERGNDIDAEEFIDHYEANGWKRGKTAISDWKACVRTWERTRRGPPAESRVATAEDLEHFDLVNGQQR